MALAIAIASAEPPAPALAIDWTLVAETGGAVPGSDGDVFSVFEEPQFTSDGRLRFVGAGSGAAPSLGVFEWSAASGLSAIASVEPAGTVVGDPAVVIQDSFVTVVLAGDSIQATHPVRVQDCPSFELNAVLDLLAQDPSRVVLQPGRLAPGFGPGWVFEGFFGTFFFGSAAPLGGPRVDRDGDRAFYAQVVERDPFCSFVPNPARALALYGPDGTGGVELVAIGGQAAPDGASGPLRFGSLLGLAEDGELFFVAYVDSGTRLYRWSASSGLRLVVEVPNPSFGPFGVRPGAPGTVLYVAAERLYRAESDGISILLHAPGDSAPGVQPGAVLRGVAGFQVAPNGTLAIDATSEVPGDPASTRWGVWARLSSGALEKRLVDGDPAPGLSDATIRHPTVAHVGNHGEVFIIAAIEGLAPGPPLTATYLSQGPSEIELLVGPDTMLEFAGAPRLVSSHATSYDAALRRVALKVGDLTGNRAVFVTELPEPGAVASAVVAALALATLRRRA